MVEIIAETPRLRLRTWSREDRGEFTRLLNTPTVMRWLGGVQREADAEAAYDRIENYHREFGHTFWIVERKPDRALLGFCGLKRINAPGAGPITGDFEIGWRLREDAWGQGYAKEAAITSLDLAFERFRAPHVIALTVPGNVASQGLMKRLRMIRRADLDYVDTRFAHPSDINPAIVYWIGAADWRAARAAASTSA